MFNLINRSSFSFIAGGLMSYLGVMDVKKYSLDFVNKKNVQYINIGEKEIIAGKPYLMISNHRSATDPIIIFAHVLKKGIWPFSFLTKKKMPFGPLLKRLSRHENIPIFFKDDPMALKAIIKLLRSNSSFLVFPEGTRNKTDSPLLPFQKGSDFIIRHVADHDLLLYYLERPEDILAGKKDIKVYYQIVEQKEFKDVKNFSIEELYQRLMPLKESVKVAMS